MIRKFLSKTENRVFYKLKHAGLFDRMSDRAYLRLLYRRSLHRRLDLKNPRTFNAKMQWLKLNLRDPIQTQMVDKAASKQYVAGVIGDKYIIPTIGIWERFDDIDFAALPDRFVLKCTHDSGGLVICRDKSALDMGKARAKIERSLKRNYYYHCREWPYKDVPPRILAEVYLEDPADGAAGRSLHVYKVFNFDGCPRLIQTIQNDKTPQETIDYFDTDWNLLHLKQNFPNSAEPLPRPRVLKELLALSAALSQGHPFLRTDFYIIGDAIYFSELTFYSDAGLARFEPAAWDETLGSWLQLPPSQTPAPKP